MEYPIFHASNSQNAANRDYAKSQKQCVWL